MEEDATPEDVLSNGLFMNAFAIGFNAYVFIFRFGTERADGTTHIHTQVVASLPGYGLAFTRWNETDAHGELILRLVEDDVPIEGRFVDLEGRPIAGVKVMVNHVGPLGDRIVQEAAQRDPEGYSDSLFLNMPFLASGNTSLIISDRDGRFRANGLVPGVRYHLRGAAFSVFEVESGKVKDLGQAKAE